MVASAALPGPHEGRPDGPPVLRLQLLGEFRVAVGAAPIPAAAWRRRKVASLLKLLALAPGHALPRDAVLEALWPDLAPAAAANNLRFTAHALRAALRAAPLTPGDMLRAWGEHVALYPDGPVATDVAAFEAAAVAARRGGDPAALETALSAGSAAWRCANGRAWRRRSAPTWTSRPLRPAGASTRRSSRAASPPATISAPSRRARRRAPRGTPSPPP